MSCNTILQGCAGDFHTSTTAGTAESCAPLGKAAPGSPAVLGQERKAKTLQKHSAGPHRGVPQFARNFRGVTALVWLEAFTG